MTESVSDALPFDRRTWCWVDTSANLHWLFGMRWLPALGAQGQRALHRDLRQQGIGLVVNHGDRVRLVGVPSADQPSAQLKHSASAAVAYALSRPQGVHALCLTVTGVGVWLVASSNGCLLSDTDRWFDCFDEAQTFFYTLRQRYEQIQLEVLQWNAEHDAAEPCPDFLDTRASKQCRLSKLPFRHRGWKLLALGLALGCAVWWLARAYWFEADADHQAAAQSHRAAPVSVLTAHDFEGVKDLVQAWHELPVDPNGWVLQAVSCRINHEAALCKATYKRSKPDADNNGLIRHKPAGWVFEPASLDIALLKRRVVMPMSVLRAHLRVSRAFGLTALQRFSARTAQLVLGTPAHINTDSQDLQSPLFADSGSATPPTASPISSWPVSVRLPLRDAERLSELNVPLRWRQIDLVIVRHAQIDERQGYLMLNLQGEWLETHE